MKKAAALVLVGLLALGAWVAAGPYLAVRAIRQAVQQQDASALARHVDFPALRGSFKAQLEDRLARRAGVDAQASPLAAFGLAIANGAAGGIIDAMVTPVGLGALMEGRAVWNRVDGAWSAPGEASPPEPRDLLRDAHYRYESPSRFTATVRDAKGDPIVFVLTRDGLAWRLTDIRLPR